MYVYLRLIYDLSGKNLDVFTDAKLHFKGNFLYLRLFNFFIFKFIVDLIRGSELEIFCAELTLEPIFIPTNLNNPVILYFATVIRNGSISTLPITIRIISASFI